LVRRGTLVFSAAFSAGELAADFRQDLDALLSLALDVLRDCRQDVL
jgi:hypothetical protein